MQDSPIGYLPFFGSKDFNLSGDISFKEKVLGRLPIDMSGVASPHTLLIREAAGDVDFMGSGDENLQDIQQAVKRDLISHTMRCASGVFIDSVMVALGGPTVKSMMNQMIKCKVKQFVLSRAITATAKSHLKKQGNIDVDKFLSRVP